MRFTFSSLIAEGEGMGNSPTLPILIKNNNSGF